MNERIIVQQEVTLDEAVLEGSSTFRNGCDYAFCWDKDDNWFIKYGCYGVHINLVTGHRKLLYQWFRQFTKGDVDDGWYPLPIHPETKLELKKRRPCEHCGQPWFRQESAATERGLTQCQHVEPWHADRETQMRCLRLEGHDGEHRYAAPIAAEQHGPVCSKSFTPKAGTWALKCELDRGHDGPCAAPSISVERRVTDEG